MSGPVIRGAPADVDADYLSEVLQHAGHDVRVSRFRAENVGTGQVGQNVRFSLEYDGSASDAPASIVGKFASDDPVSRQTGIALNNYLKEVCFYRELNPTLDVQTPEVLFTDINPQSHDFVLFMEDLAPAEQGDQLAACDLAAAQLGITEIAKLHGPRWADESLWTIDWLRSPDPGDDTQTVGSLYNDLLPGYEDRYAERLPERYLALGRALGERFESYAQPPGGASTVVHGDFRLDNLMFGGRYPLAVVDWQSPVIGNPGQDLAYFVGTSLDPAVRREADNDLVAAYHEQLTAYSGVDLTLDDCRERYRHYAFAGWVMAVIASMIVGQTERGDDMFMAMATRSAQMALDLDSLDALSL